MSVRRTHQEGVTLVELLVAIVIGFIVVIAGLSLYLASVSNSGVHRSQARLTSDLANAIAVLSGQIRMAGYSALRANAQGTTIQTRTYEGPAVRGCEGGFADPSSFSEPLCNATSAADAIALHFETDVHSAAVIGGVPLDCRGAQVPISPVPPHLVVGGLPDVFHLVELRIYVVEGANGVRRLVCSGNGGDSPFSGPLATLAEGVVDFQLTYKLSDPSGMDAAQATAQEVVALYGDAAQAWRNVHAVNVCLVLSSPVEVLDAPASYVGCSGEVVSPPDRKLYRVGRTSLALRNQIPSGL